MNEMMIILKDGWIYFPTKQTDARLAFDEFEAACNSVGINIDNINFCKVVIRDADGYDIDGMILTKGKF